MAGGTASRLLIYSQDGFGLGHLRRNINIAYQIRTWSPSTSILIVADSPAAPFFTLPPQCDFVKIPTLVKVDAGIWRSDRLVLLAPARQVHAEVMGLATPMRQAMKELESSIGALIADVDITQTRPGKQQRGNGPRQATVEAPSKRSTR